MKIVWSILCDYAFFDHDKKTCMMGTFANIFAQTVPIVVQRFFLVSRLQGPINGEAMLKVQLLRPSGATMSEQDLPVAFGPVGGADHIYNIGALMVPDYGVYTWRLTLGDSAPLDVQFEVVPALAQSPVQPNTMLTVH